MFHILIADDDKFCIVIKRCVLYNVYMSYLGIKKNTYERK